MFSSITKPTPSHQEPTLDELLAGSPKSRLKRTQEDREWLEEPSKEKECCKT